MYGDDYEERRRASNEYLNRREDQLAFESDLARRRDAIYDALRTGDHSRTSWELGIVPEDTDSEAVNATDPREVGTTESRESLTEQIRHQVQEVLAILLASDLPTSSKEDWIKRLDSPNWSIELKALRREVALDREASLGKFFKIDLYNPSTLDTASMDLRHLDFQLFILDDLVSKQQVLNDQIREKRQEILDVLRESDLSFKKDWIKRLSSPNWRTELNPLRRQIAFLRPLLRPLPVFFPGKRDWLSELDTQLLSLEALVSRE